MPKPIKYMELSINLEYVDYLEKKLQRIETILNCAERVSADKEAIEDMGISAIKHLRDYFKV